MCWKKSSDNVGRSCWDVQYVSMCFASLFSVETSCFIVISTNMKRSFAFGTCHESRICLMLKSSFLGCHESPVWVQWTSNIVYCIFKPVFFVKFLKNFKRLDGSSNSNQGQPKLPPDTKFHIQWPPLKSNNIPMISKYVQFSKSNLNSFHFKHQWNKMYRS